MASELFKLVGTIAIDATSATQNINAVITAGEDLEEKLKGIGENADSSIGQNSGFGTASVWLGNMLTELTHRAAQLGKEFVLSGLKYNAAMEGYEVTFGTLLNGDMEKAKQLMKDITAFALDSPLNVSGVSAAALQLLNIGTAYEDVMPTLEMLGNLALGDANKMDRLSIALSQVMGFGQLYGQEKQQFVNAGVPIYKLLEDYYKIVEGMDTVGLDLDAMQRKGDILAEHVLGALQLATMSDEDILEKFGYSGERAVSFYNAMSAMLPTYTGQTQKAGEQTDIAAGAIVAPYQEEATQNVLPAYTELMSAVAEKYQNDEQSKDVAKGVSGFITDALNSLTDAVSGKYDITPENEENLTPFGKFVAGVYGFEDLWNELRKKEVDPDADNGGGGRRLDEGTDKLPSRIDQILNWLIPSAGAEEGYYGGAAWNPDLGGMWRDPRFDLDNPGSANSLQGMFADLPARIEDAARAGSAAGVAEGVGKISVTGTVTTGPVVLDSGAVVGELTPKINMALGSFYEASYNDD